MKLFVFILQLLATFSLYAQQAPSVEDLHWLSGTWAIEKARNTYEEWNIANDTTLAGRSYKVNGSDTIVSETLEIVQTEQAIWYIPTVPNQNEGKPIPFRLVNSDVTKLTFENKAHDFPRRINYFKEGNHAIRVWIEGEVNGQIKKISFDMKRIR